MNVLITGASGQDGYYLTALCRAHGAQVIGAGRSGPDVKLDVADLMAVRKLMQECRPDYVFHLAADSTVEHGALFANHAAIGAGTVNILESCWNACRGARVFVPGSAMQFAN